MPDYSNKKNKKRASVGYAIITNNITKGSGINNHIFKCRKTRDNTKDLEQLSKKCRINLIYKPFINIDIIVDEKMECGLRDSQSECSMVELEKNEFTGLQKHSCNINGVFNLELIFYFKKEQSKDGNIYSVFYTENKKEMMILSALIGKSICGNCVSTLYNINKK